MKLQIAISAEPLRTAIDVRPEKAADYKAIDDLLAPLMGDEVAALVHDIRRSDNYVPDLALVAEKDGDIMGHILLSYVTLRGKEETAVLLLSPLGVRPDHQRLGIGTALVRAALKVAEARKEPLVVVEGVPSYYPRLGFERARPRGIEPPHLKIPDEAWMVRPLSAYSPRYRGLVEYPPAFDPFS